MIDSPNKVVLFGAPRMGAPSALVSLRVSPRLEARGRGSTAATGARGAGCRPGPPRGAGARCRTRKAASGYPGRPSNRAPGEEDVRRLLGGSLLLCIDARIAGGTTGCEQKACVHAAGWLRKEAGGTAEDRTGAESRDGEGGQAIGPPMPRSAFSAQLLADHRQARLRLGIRHEFLKGEDHGTVTRLPVGRAVS